MSARILFTTAALGASAGCTPYPLEGPAAPSVSILEHTEHGGVVLLASARLAELRLGYLHSPTLEIA